MQPEGEHELRDLLQHRLVNLTAPCSTGRPKHVVHTMMVKRALADVLEAVLELIILLLLVVVVVVLVLMESESLSTVRQGYDSKTN